MNGFLAEQQQSRLGPMAHHDLGYLKVRASFGGMKQQGSPAARSNAVGRNGIVHHSGKPTFFSRWTRDQVQRALECSKAVSVFLANIPTGWLASDVYKEMAKIGVVIDVFIPGKLTWEGIRYCFVRFEYSGVVNDLLTKINSSKSINGMLKANMARSRRGNMDKGSMQKSKKIFRRFERNAKVKEGCSYAQAVESHALPEGVSPAAQSEQHQSRQVSFVFNPTEGCLSRLGRCAFGMMRDGIAESDLIQSLNIITNSAVEIKHLGGRYILISFKSREALLSFLKHKEAWEDKCFELLKEWEVGDCATQRECCLNIYGAPPHAWCEEFFSQITVSFGKFIKLHNDLDSCNNLEVAKVQLMTTYREPISRSFRVMIASNVYDIAVVEAQSIFLCRGGMTSIKEDGRKSEQGCKVSSVEGSSDSCPEVYTPRVSGDRRGIEDKGGEVQKSQDPFGILDIINYMEKGKSVLEVEAEEKTEAFGQRNVTRLTSDGFEVDKVKRVANSQQTKSRDRAPSFRKMAESWGEEYGHASEAH
ncbi:hypothetical protein Tsubulata_010641 [Turnera subulata]|uniref:RRM domain-containing protein n=1 Tax=Turnera subulata TaxID=218843 RepID=A0A9Q0FLM1_9ROSI|nr:hypothetical protein Tsubulata_010641 [Turnera subulata]